jgi:DNA-binding XRE family transcriptional regulator
MGDLEEHDFDDLLKLEMRNKEFAEAYNALDKEYSLAKEFIALRKENNLTQLELAKLAGTSQSAIARLESGNYKNLSLSFIRKVAAALHAVPEIHIRRIS